MNYSLILSLVGSVLRIEAAVMLVPLIVSLILRQDDRFAFAISILIIAAVGIPLGFVKPKEKKLKNREAFASAALSWVVLSLFGALPYLFSAHYQGFVNCVFESISGFTTTSATVLSNVEILPRGLVLWRSLSVWIGGMGVLVFMLAVLPAMNASSFSLMLAESPGPSTSRIVPRIRETARFMYAIYIAMTGVLALLLMLTGLPVFDSFIHAFSVAGTGGFSNMNSSIGAYNNAAAELVITIFMIFFGISFTLYYHLIRRSFRKVYKDEELRAYLGLVAVATVIIAINISGMYGSFGEAVRRSGFHVASLVSTSAFFTQDYNTWPTLSRAILLLLMVSGCCSGSTGGGVKVMRLLLLFRTVKVEISRVIHPRSVKPVLHNGARVADGVVSGVLLFAVLYVALFFVSFLVVSADGKDLPTTATAVIASLSNIGPGLGLVGPTGNYESFSSLSKLVLSFCMLAGRLEFLPVLVMLTPSIWKKNA